MVGCNVLFVTVWQVIPVDLAEVPPGSELAGVLAGIELSRLMAAMVEVGLCGVDPVGESPRVAFPDEFSADEIRAALVLTRRAADAQFWLAYDLLTRLPAVHAAMDAGGVDEPRARVLSEWTTELPPETARALCAELLPRVPGLTTGQLIEQIKKLAIALDPDWARRRYEQAIAQRQVIGRRNPDGSANLSVRRTRPDSTCSSTGSPQSPDISTRWPRPPNTPTIPARSTTSGRTCSSAWPTAPTPGWTMRPSSSTSASPTATRTNPATVRKTTAPTMTPAGPATAGPVGGGPSGGPDGGAGGVGSAVDELALHDLAGAGMELRVRLSTLARPRPIPGRAGRLGPLHAELARDLTATLGGAQWRFAITDEHGQLLHRRITRARPTGTSTRMAGCRTTVEVQIPAATLHAFGECPFKLGTWARVVTDLLHQLDGGTAGQDCGIPRRAPGAALRRCLEARDRSCVMIGCRAPPAPPTSHRFKRGPSS